MEAAGPRDNLMARFRAHLAEGETSDRTFGFTIGTLLLALSFAPELRHRPPVVWMAVLGTALLLLGAVAPRTLQPFRRAWLFLGFALGLVVSPLVLAALFYAGIAPCGFLMRLFGGDPLRLKPTKKEESYWRARTTPVSSMNDQF